MQPFDLRSKGSQKPVSWENGKPLPCHSHAGSSLLLGPACPLILLWFAPSRPVHSHYDSSTNPNPPPKSMASQISPIGGEYKVRTITGDEFDVIYTRSSATVKGWDNDERNAIVLKDMRGRVGANCQRAKGRVVAFHSPMIRASESPWI